jgi:hypothetical protein
MRTRSASVWAESWYPRERRVGREVVPDEDARLAYERLDAIPAAGPLEVALEALRRDALGDARVVLCRASTADRPVADVAPEHLDRERDPPPLEVLEQADGERVGLLAAGAAWHPHADGSAARPARRDERRKDAVVERGEHLGVPEEARDVDEEVVVQRGQLRVVGADALQVLAEPRRAHERGAAGDPPP